MPTANSGFIQVVERGIEARTPAWVPAWERAHLIQIGDQSIQIGDPPFSVRSPFAGSLPTASLRQVPLPNAAAHAARGVAAPSVRPPSSADLAWIDHGPPLRGTLQLPRKSDRYRIVAEPRLDSLSQNVDAIGMMMIMFPFWRVPTAMYSSLTQCSHRWGNVHNVPNVHNVHAKCAYCPRSPVLGHLFWVACPGSPVLGHLSCITCRGSLVLGSYVFLCIPRLAGAIPGNPRPVNSPPPALDIVRYQMCEDTLGHL